MEDRAALLAFELEAMPEVCVSGQPTKFARVSSLDDGGKAADPDLPCGCDTVEAVEEDRRSVEKRNSNGREVRSSEHG